MTTMNTEAQIVVEIKFQAIKFQQKDNCLIKISNIDKIVQGEHDKAKAAYQQALTATVSHEQMTPLNSILNLSDLLIAKARDHIQNSESKISLTKDDLKSDIDTLKVINSSTHMMKIMNQSLLDSQAISDGELRLCYRVMSPKAAIQQLVDFFNIQIMAKTIKVSITIDESKQNFPSKIVCDNSRFQEMIFHILANAIKFNKEHGGMIEIILSYEVKVDGNGGGILRCKICDTGCGMTAEQIENSFEAFGNVKVKKQKEEDGGASSNNVMTTSGIGLGISTSFKLAGAMNGKLSIVSQPKDEENPDKISGTQVSMHIECFMVEKQDEIQQQEDNKVKIQKRKKKSK